MANRLLVLGACGFWLLAFLPARALAEATQEEVLRSIGQNVSESGDSGRALGVLAALGGAIALLVVLGQRRPRPAGPKALRHHGKLLKEVLRTVPLKPAELKQLKHLTEHSAGAEAVQSPLTLVLCPSLLAKAAQQKSDKINRKVVAGLAKKLVSRS